MRDKLKEALGKAPAAGDMLRKALTRIDNLVNTVSGLGTAADAAIYGRPSVENRLELVELDRLYLQNDLARRIVEELVDDALRQGFEVKDADSGELVEEPEELDIENALRAAGYASRLYGGAAVVMLYGTDAEKPLESDGGVPLNLLVVDRYEATAADYEGDPLNANFGCPNKWRISPNNQAAAIDLGSPVFHDSRLLRLRGAPLPSRLKTMNDGWDDSVLQMAWTPLQNFTSSEQAIANIIQRFETAVYSFEGLRDVLDDPDGAGDILQRFQLIQKTISMVNAVVVDKSAGEDYTRAFSSVNGLDTLWDRLAHSVAKASRMPMTQLFGMSPSGLATDDQSGRANWRKQVAVYQDTVLSPLLHRYFRLINKGKPVSILWHPLDESTAREEAEIAKMRAETREIYVSVGAAVPEEFRVAMQKEGIIESADDEAFEEANAEPELDPAGGEFPAPREDPNADIPAPADEDEGEGSVEADEPVKAIGSGEEE